MTPLRESNQLSNEQIVHATIDIQAPKNGNTNWYSGDKNRVIMAYVTAKAWEDTTYKASLMANPKLILQEEGIEGIPASLQIQVLENTPIQNQLADAPMQQSPGTPEGTGLVLVQNTDKILYLILSDKPGAFIAALSPKETQDMTFFGPANHDIAVNVEVTANAVASVNAVVASNVGVAAVAVIVLV